jgi:hypothetical protein
VLEVLQKGGANILGSHVPILVDGNQVSGIRIQGWARNQDVARNRLKAEFLPLVRFVN